MASKTTINLTARDTEILSALIKTPLDARQLLLFSSTLEQPFTHERLVRRRLSQLVDSGLVSCFQYAAASAKAMNYYKPTREGYRLVQGMRAQPPPRSFFREVSLSLQEHTRALAEFIVKTHVAANRQGIELTGFYRENELRLKLGKNVLQPDCAFQLVMPDGRSFNYLIEIDCATEPIRSTKQRDSLESKIRFYDGYQDKTDARFRVLVLFTKPSTRMSHFCQVADAVIADPQRTLFCAALLPDYLRQRDPLTSAVFLDRHEKLQSLLPQPKQASFRPEPTLNSTVLLTGIPTVW